MKKKWFSILIIIFVSFSLFCGLLLKPSFTYISGYLSKSEEIKANILLVEGWLPEDAFELVYNEFRKKEYEYVVTTGIISDKPYFKVYSNGYLNFHPHEKLAGSNNEALHSIKINAYSELDGDNCAHFNLYINDSLKGDSFVERRKGSYVFTWEGSLSDLKSISIQFTNDDRGDYGDRNLYVKGIIIDDKIKIPYLNNSEYDLGKPDGKNRSINNINSSAEVARNMLLSLGIDSAKIIAVPGKKVKINRTLSSALAFRDWSKMAGVNINGINIISLGPHARRTWMTYNKILDKKFKIGIISIPDDNLEQTSGIRKSFKTLRELLGLVYYWFLLIPY